MENKRILAEPTRLARIVDNWRNNVRGVDVAIDQVHDPDRGAAGWIRDLKIGPSTTNPGKQALFAKVEWTPLGKELVGGGIFRYMSAEFGPHKDAETGTEYQDVLYASTLTNRPFVKGLSPVTLDDEWVEVLREGDYIHDTYGQLSIQADEGDTGWMRRLYQFLGSRLKAGEPAIHNEAQEAAETVAFAMRTDDGKEYPASAYLFVPDPDKPSTWKLRIKEYVGDTLKVTREQLGRAAAALSPGGFRGNRVELPSGEVAKVKAKLRSLYREIGVSEDDIPAHIKQEENKSMDKLIAYLKELGIELANGVDPVDALRKYIVKQKTTASSLETAMAEEKNKRVQLEKDVATLTAKLDEKQKATSTPAEIAMAEEKNKRLQLEKDVAALTAKLEESERTAFLDEMTRQGKLLPAERPYFNDLYKTSKDIVRKLLGERPAKVDLGEHGASTTKTIPVEDRRLAKMEELIAGGMTPEAAYKRAHREVQ